MMCSVRPILSNKCTDKVRKREYQIRNTTMKEQTITSCVHKCMLYVSNKHGAKSSQFDSNKLVYVLGAQDGDAQEGNLNYVNMCTENSLVLKD